MTMQKLKHLLIAALLGLACTPAAAVIVLLAPGSMLDFNTDSTADLEAVSGGSITAIRQINGTLLAKLAEQIPGTAWENVTLELVQGLKYTDPKGSQVPQSFPGVFEDIFIYKTPDQQFYKLRDQGPNTGSGITVEWEFVGSGAPPPPSASFTFSSFDIVADFTDTSTGSAASWDWDFGDGNNSSSQNPTHVYAGAGSFNVCLIASNAGGDSAQVCQNVTITEEPSTTVTSGLGLDLDSDGLDDILVEADTGCGVDSPNRFAPQNAAEAGAVLKDYRNVVLADAQAAATSTQLFCHPEADFDTTMIVSSSNDFFYKLWTPENDASGVRFVFELLGTPPPPPVADFSFSSFDLVAEFNDQSTGVVTSWLWDFGDGDSATSPDVSHVYANAGTFTVCLTVANAGGASAPSCEDVTVAEVPSTTIASGAGIDLDGDSLEDLLTELSGLGLSHQFILQNGSQRSSVNKFYPDVVLADAQAAAYDLQTFGHPAADPDTTMLIITSNNRFVKAWTPGNDASGVRMQFEDLGGVTPSADLSISLSDSVDPVVAGGTLLISAEVTNNGSFTADDVVISFNFPSGLTPVATSGCSEDPSGTPSCSLGSLSSGASSTVVVSVNADPDGSGQLSSSATVASSTQDPQPGNNSDSELTTLVAVVDLVMDKVSNSIWAPTGGTINYVLTVSNLGPSAALGANIVDLLPLRLGNASWSCSPGPTSTCAASGVGDIDELVDIGAADSIVIALQAELLDQDEIPITNTATVAASAGVTDTDPGNNSDADTDIVGQFADGMESGEPD